MDYSGDEKKAMSMVEAYFSMIEGAYNPRDEKSPFQDRREMLLFLQKQKGKSKVIQDLIEWVWDYELNRSELRRLSEKKGFLERQLFIKLGRSAFS
jgi:hypothetical protein